MLTLSRADSGTLPAPVWHAFRVPPPATGEDRAAVAEKCYRPAPAVKEAPDCPIPVPPGPPLPGTPLHLDLHNQVQRRPLPRHPGLLGRAAPSPPGRLGCC